MEMQQDSRDVTGELKQIKQDILAAIRTKNKSILIVAVTRAVLYIGERETLSDTEGKSIAKFAADFLDGITQDAGNAMCSFNLFDRCFAYLQFSYNHKTKAVSFSLTGLKIFPEMQNKFDEMFN